MGTTAIYSGPEQQQNPALISARADASAGEFDRDSGRGERVPSASPGAPQEMRRHAAAESLADELQRDAGGTERVTRETRALLLATRARQRAAWMSRSGRRLQPETGAGDTGS